MAAGRKIAHDIEKGPNKILHEFSSYRSSARAQHQSKKTPTEAELHPLYDENEKLSEAQLQLGASISQRFTTSARPVHRKALNCLYLIAALLFVALMLTLYGKIHYGSVEGTGNVVEDLVGGVSCTACRAAISSLKALAVNETEFAERFIGICIDFQIQKPDVCRGAVGAQSRIIAHALNSLTTLDSEGANRFCSTIFGLCANRAVMPYKVVHLTDAHIDRDYTPGSEAECGRPICCANFDSGVNITSPAEKWGDYRCDMPPILFESMLQSIQKTLPNVSFTIFTGDAVDGNIWQDTQTGVSEDLTSFHAQLPAKTYSTLGNHDTAPVNSFIRPETKTNSSAWLYNQVALEWEQEEAKTHAGCYSEVVPDTQLKIISLNTMYWYTRNLWLLDTDKFQPDPAGIIAFLVRELQAAEDAQQRVWILGHVPFGASDCVQDQSHYLNQVIQRFDDTIAGLFFGHWHQDRFEIGYSDNDNKIESNAIVVAFSAAGATPKGDSVQSANPSWRYYDVDPDTYEVMDIHTYYADVLAPGFQSGPEWKPYYSVRESYGPLVNPPLSAEEALSPSFYHRLTEELATNNDTMRLYQKRLSAGRYNSECTGECLTSTICSLRALRSEDDCSVVEVGLHFRKRSFVEEEIHQAWRKEKFPCDGILIDSIAEQFTLSLNDEI